MDSGFLIVATRIVCFCTIMAIVLLFLGACSLILLHIMIVSRACRRALSSTVNRGEGFADAGNGLSFEEVEKLPCFAFSALDAKGADMDCPVCLESFELGDLCRQLPACRHSFHAQCVDCWLVRSPICPICRSGAGHRRSGNEVVLSSD